MAYRFTDATGQTVMVPDFGAFADMVTSGRITADTMLYDETLAVWKRAGETGEYHAAVARLTAAPVMPGNDAGRRGLRGIDIVFLAIAALLLLAAALLKVIAIFGFGASPNQAAYNLGKMMGFALLAVILIALVWRFVPKAFRAAGAMMLCGVFFLTSLGEFGRKVGEARMNQMSMDVVRAIAERQLKGEPIEAMRIDEKTYGSMTPILRLLNDLGAQAQQDQQGMGQELDEQQLATVLTVATFRDSREIVAAQQRLQKALEIFDRYEARARARLEELSARVSAMDVPENVKQGFLQAYNQDKGLQLQKLSEFYAIQRSVIATSGQVLEFVRARRGKYSIEGEDIIFHVTADADAYNQYLGEIQRLAEQETEWDERNQREAREKMEKLGK